MSLSVRLEAIVDSLPLRPDSRVLEIGCGPGAAARAVAERLAAGYILAIDRSATAIAQARTAAAEQITSGRMGVRQVASRTSSWRRAKSHTTSSSRFGLGPWMADIPMPASRL